jgi:hypothetical protein
MQRNNSVLIGGQGKVADSESLDDKSDSTFCLDSREIVDQSITPLIRFRMYIS